MSQILQNGDTLPDKGTAALRRQNKERLISLIAEGEPITRGKLAELTGLTGAAVSRITRELIDSGIVKEGDPIIAPRRVGRREYHLTINPDGAYVLGISITANRRNVCLANARGDVLQTIDCNDLDIKEPHSFLKELSTRAKALIYDTNFDQSRLVGAGISMAMSMSGNASIDHQNVDSDPLGWYKVPVRQLLADSLNLPIILEHRAAALLRGELRKGKYKGNVYFVNAALGIGSSAYFGDRFLIPGDDGFGALSHFALQNIDKEYGGSISLEALASGKAVLKMLEKEMHFEVDSPSNLSIAIKAASHGNTIAKTAFYNAGTKLAFGIDAVLSLFRPDYIILAGEVGRQNDYFKGLLQTLEQFGTSNYAEIVKQSSITSDEAAVSVALHNLLYKRDFEQ